MLFMAYSRKYGHTCGITKKGQYSPVKGYSFGLLPLIFRTLHPPKQHVFLEVLVEKRAFRFSIRALRAGTACNESLK